VAAVLVLNTPDDGRLSPKHVEWPCRNKTCTVLHQVGVSFVLYYDARKHKINILCIISLSVVGYLNTVILLLQANDHIRAHIATSRFHARCYWNNICASTPARNRSLVACVVRRSPTEATWHFICAYTPASSHTRVSCVPRHSQRNITSKHT